MAPPHELLAAARRIADDLLFPNAALVDQATIVPRSHLDALAAAGLFGLAGPAAFGGSAVDPHTFRRIMATIASGCGATFFVWVQHHGVVRTVAASPNPTMRALAAELCHGTKVAGTAFAHLRRPTPAVIARPSTPERTAWTVSGTAPWATSWGIADVFAFAAATRGSSTVGDSSTDPSRFQPNEVVWAIAGTGHRRDTLPVGVTTETLALPVLGATGTVALHFDGAVVDADQVASVESLDRWRRADRLRAALGQPAPVGVAERAVSLLRDRSDADASSAATRLADEIAHTWDHDRVLVERSATLAADLDRADGDDDDLDRAVDEYVREASEHRARCLDLARRATTAALAAAGGRAMDLGHPAQRLAREAAFYVIQAQSADGRSATLRAVSTAADGTPTRRGAGTPADASRRTN